MAERPEREEESQADGAEPKPLGVFEQAWIGIKGGVKAAVKAIPSSLLFATAMIAGASLMPDAISNWFGVGPDAAAAAGVQGGAAAALKIVPLRIMQMTAMGATIGGALGGAGAISQAKRERETQIAQHRCQAQHRQTQRANQQAQARAPQRSNEMEMDALRPNIPAMQAAQARPGRLRPTTGRA